MPDLDRRGRGQTSWIPHHTDPLGAFMNIMATVSLILVVGISTVETCTDARRWDALLAWWCLGGFHLPELRGLPCHGATSMNRLFAGVAGIAAV